MSRLLYYWSILLLVTIVVMVDAVNKTHTQSLSTTFSRSLSKSVTPTPSRSSNETASASLDLSSSLTTSHTHSFSVTLSGSHSLSTSMSPSLSGSASLTLTLTEDITPSDTLQPTDSVTHTLSETLTLSRSLRETLSEVLTLSATETFSLGFTTSMLPATTTIPITETQTLRAFCPKCLHGICSADTRFYCQCYADTARGFWQGGIGGGACEDCAVGYYGSDCLRPCPGGACNPCNGHGVCDSGVLSLGTCSCSEDPGQGYWGGHECSSCRTGYYGGDCKTPCLCGPKGTCDDGLFGSGLCSCSDGWSGSRCDQCDPALIENCVACPNLCSGHGICGDALNGTLGICQCDPFYGTEDCSEMCPSHCGGSNGHCFGGSSGNATCRCKEGYNPPGCTECTGDRYGLSCDLNCSCSGKGRCDRITGECICRKGFTGSTCEINCTRSDLYSGKVCAGHGECDAVGGCACFRNPDFGYWQGSSCDSCDHGFTGPECKVVCPITSENRICNNHGNCTLNATCICEEGWCGEVCKGKYDTVTAMCSPCPIRGYFGAACEHQCKCLHGSCSEGWFGTGKCTCTPGYYGSACDEECPGGASTPCSGHGSCDVDTGECDCGIAHAGFDCSVPCELCVGNGKCDFGRRGTGKCLCDPGWISPETGCNIPCNCTAEGTCDAFGSCVCSERWNGTKCEVCADGYSGDDCSLRCVVGHTQNKTCVCDKDVGGNECELPCPKSFGQTCSSSGFCQEGQGQPGTCLCFAGYYGPVCECHDDTCEQESLGRRICNRVTGACECKANRTGTNCELCSRNRWGSDCNLACQCSERGVCDRQTGNCLCDSSDELGYWGGDQCDQCVKGYVGTQCQYHEGVVVIFPALHSRYDVPTHDHHEMSKYIQLDQAARTVVAGGAIQHAAFEIDSKTSRTNVKRFTTQEIPYCASHLNSWILADVQYMLGSRGAGCADIVQLYILATNPGPIQSVVLSTKYKTLQHSTMFVDQSGNVVLCYVPPQVRGSSNKVLLLTCHLVSTSGIGPTTGSPSQSFSAELSTADEVYQIAYSRSLDSVMVLVHTESLGCIVQVVNLNSNNRMLSVSDTHFVLHTQGKCFSASCLTEVNGVFLVMATTTEVASLNAFTLGDRDPQLIEVRFPNSKCAGIAVDHESQLGMVVVQNVRTAFTIRFSVTVNATSQTAGLTMLGSRTLLGIRVSALMVDSISRQLFAALESATGLVVMRYFLPDILSVSPVFADRRGGTVITVNSKGLRDSVKLSCKFGDMLVKGTMITNDTVTCIAPEVSSSLCEERAVELSLNGWVDGFTNNKVRLQRVEPPLLRSAEPRRVRKDFTGEITVRGQGFVPTHASISCKYSDGVSTFVSAATFRSTIFVTCSAPIAGVGFPQALFANGTVDVSLDGDKYTGAGVLFTVIGEPNAITASSKVLRNFSSTVTVFSDNVIVSLLDTHNNLIGDSYGAAVRVVHSWFQREVNTSNATRTFDMRKGIAEILSPTFKEPKVGDITVYLTLLPQYFRSSFKISIVQGSLHHATLIQQPSAEVFAGGTMSVAPRVRLFDVSGNVWVPDTITFVLLTARAGHIDGEVVTVQSETVSGSGDVEFFHVALDTKFGIEFILTFTVVGHPHVAPIHSRRITAHCASDEFRFAKDGGVTCLECLVGATCNGSDVIILSDGFWRDNQSLPSVFACQRVKDCIGGQSIGQCSSGYEGPLCSFCSPNHGKTHDGDCVECGARGLVVFIVIGSVFMSIALTGLLILLCLQYYDLKREFLVVVFIALDLGQTMSMTKNVGEKWSPVFENAFLWSSMLSDFELHTLASGCELANQGKTYLDKAIFYYVAILFAPFLALLLRGILKLWPRIALTPEARKSRAKSKKRTPLHHKLLPVMATTLQVYLFATYQTTVSHALGIFQCEEVSQGDTPKNLMVLDLRIDCDTQEYKSARGMAIFVCIVYGLVLPLLTSVATAALISRFRQTSKDQLDMLLSFQLLGLKDHCWYWQTVIMVRRFATLVSSIWNIPPLDSYITMWVILGYTCLLWYVRPYAKDGHNTLAIVAFFGVYATINSGLMVTSSPWQELDIATITLTVLYYVVVMVMMLYNSAEVLKQLMLYAVSAAHRVEIDDEQQPQVHDGLTFNAEARRHTHAKHDSPPPALMLPEKLTDDEILSPSYSRRHQGITDEKGGDFLANGDEADHHGTRNGGGEQNSAATPSKMTPIFPIAKDSSSKQQYRDGSQAPSHSPPSSQQSASATIQLPSQRAYSQDSARRKKERRELPDFEFDLDL